MKILNKKIKAFTLVELIVVVAIIGILALIVSPSIAKSITDGKNNSVNQNAKLMYRALQDRVNKIAIERMDDKILKIECVNTKAMVTMQKKDGTTDKFDWDLSNALGKDVTSGSWVVNVDPDKFIVNYVLWAKENYSSFPGTNFKSYKAQKSYNKNVKSANAYVGCYPIGL